MDQSDAQVRLVADDGTLLKHDTYKVDLSDDELRDLYVKLVVVRRIDTEGTNLQRQGQLGIWAPCLGQEAAQVGSGCALAPGDFVFPSYREHGVAYVRGVDIMKILQLYRGVSLSGWDPHEKNFALYTIPIGTQALHAVGYAIGAKWDGAEQCTAVYFGDGGTSEGDANDVLAVLAVTRAAADRARDGGGPTLIEAVTYRLGAHTTTDFPTRSRTADDLDMWMAREPIGRYRACLEKAGLWSEELDRTAKGEADATAARIRAAVEEMPSPPLEDLVDHVYTDPPATLRRQFERLQRFESEFVAEE